MSETKPSVTLDGEGGGCCACISVKYSPVSAGEMTQEQWMCQECGTEFVKKFWLDKALTELKRIKEATSIISLTAAGSKPRKERAND